MWLQLYLYFYRLLYHKSTSMEDLTDFVKAAKQREDDIKDGKIYPYEKRKLLKEEQDKLDQGILLWQSPSSVI